MRYIESKDDNDISISIKLEAKLNTAYTGKNIYNIFINEFNFMEEKTKTNRIMYPEFKVVGASFKKDEFSGHITNDKIEVKINTTNFDKQYEIISSWFNRIQLKIPNKNKFTVTNIVIHSNKNNHDLVLDSSKLSVNYIQDSYTSNTGITDRLYELQNFIYLDLFDLNMNIEESIDNLNKVLKQKYILIVQSDS